MLRDRFAVVGDEFNGDGFNQVAICFHPSH